MNAESNARASFLCTRHCGLMSCGDGVEVRPWAAVIADAEGLTAAPARLQNGAEPLTPATRQEITETLAYALRLGMDDKARRTGHEHLAPLAAV